MYIDAICGTYSGCSELVALCDTSSVRISYHKQRIGRPDVPAYLAGDFTRMLKERGPDVVVVTTVDAYHHEYIVAAMEHGCDVVCEKPMTIDAVKVAEILDVIDRTGRRLTVTFNYRYSPAYSKLRELIAGGAIGTPRLVDFSWMLDTSHGADYFRRWHREKDMSGGLLVHKATHHFDLVNWWIGAWPRTVFAMGGLAFYGRDAAAARGERYDYDRYAGGPADDPFAIDLSASPALRGLYLDAEAESGYLRDRNVFGGNVTAEDTLAVTAGYRGGALLSYSLIAYSPWEGLQVAITGDKGRLELAERHDVYQQIRLFRMFGEMTEVEVGESPGGPHGGDALMLAQIFDPRAPEDPLGRNASHLDGAASVLLGAAANTSIATGAPVQVSLPETNRGAHA
jgi:predicted dehydrogenase